MNRLTILLFALAPMICAAEAQETSAVERDQLARAMGLRPGLWTNVFVLESIDIEPLPGRPPVPPETVARARSRIGVQVNSDDCVSQMPARGGDLLLPGVRLGRTCRIELLEASGGRMRYSARCPSGSGSTMGPSGEATYTPTSIEGRHVVSGDVPGQGVSIRSTMRMSSRHEGQCLPRAPRPAR